MKKARYLLVGLVLMCGLGMQAITPKTMITIGESMTLKLSTLIYRGLPVVVVETDSAQLPTCDYVSAPAGCMGSTITNATKVPGRMVIYKRYGDIDSVVYDSGDYEKDISGMTIKIRGNTSAYDIKKPYKIKLQKKADLLCAGVDSIYKDKEWLLLRDDYLTTAAGFKVSEMLGMAWTPRHQFVNLVINGDYRGVYLLCEAVKRNPDCRLNVDKLSGYIFECDPYWWNESAYVTSSAAPTYNYTFKYPDGDEILPEQLEYMQALVNDYEASLANGTYPEMIDVASFAKWCLVHDIMGTQDAGGANRYYTKYDTTSQTKIVMPLAWDFDMAERTTNDWSQSHTALMMNLFNSPNRAFVREFADEWYRVRSTFLEDYLAFWDEFSASQEGNAMVSCYTYDKIVYNRGTLFSITLNARRTWINNRYPWIDNMITSMCPLGDLNTDGIVDVSDISDLIDVLLTGSPRVRYIGDMDGNGVVDVSDAAILISTILG